MMASARQVCVGNVRIGGGSPVSIQSMCNTKTSDIAATVSQIRRLEDAGCEIARVAVPDMESARALAKIRNGISIPLVADIHFDYRLAIESAKHADKLRINPGNIGSREKVNSVVDAARNAGIPIRIGVNLGSLENDIEKRLGRTAEAMVESAKRHISLLEERNFSDIVVSLKASDIMTSVEACRMFSRVYGYPIHIGITESGAGDSGIIRSSIGLGILLSEGIGDTIRVSLSGDPVREVHVAKSILKQLGLRKGLKVTSCPTCARTGFDVERYARLIEGSAAGKDYGLHIAVMGCEVNGPGEAKGADIALVGCREGGALLYVNGKFSRKVSEEKIIGETLKEADRLNGEKNK